MLLKFLKLTVAPSTEDSHAPSEAQVQHHQCYALKGES